MLIVDGNYPFGTGGNPAAVCVYLKLAPGLVTVTDVLRVLVEAMPIEVTAVIQPASGAESPIFSEFRAILPSNIALEPLERFEFYDAGRDPNTALVIATGEQRIYANILLTIGVVMPCSHLSQKPNTRLVDSPLRI